MSFFEYLSNNLTYLFIVIGAIVLVIAAAVVKYFVLKKWKKIDAEKKAKSVPADNDVVTSEADELPPAVGENDVTNDEEVK